MKRILLTLIMIFGLCSSVSAQSKFGWDNSYGVGIGYSNIYTTSDFVYGDEPRDLLTIDMKLCGVYVAFGGGWSGTHWDEFHNADRLSTYTLKIGPSFALLVDYYSRFTFTPFIGGLWHNQEYSDLGWDWYTDRQCYERKFMYGARVSYDYKEFEIGAHISNYELGFTIGYNLAF